VFRSFTPSTQLCDSSAKCCKKKYFIHEVTPKGTKEETAQI
jgi:hypothetical protein